MTDIHSDHTAVETTWYVADWTESWINLFYIALAATPITAIIMYDHTVRIPRDYITFMPSFDHVLVYIALKH